MVPMCQCTRTLRMNNYSKYGLVKVEPGSWFVNCWMTPVDSLGDDFSVRLRFIFHISLANLGVRIVVLSLSTLFLF